KKPRLSDHERGRIAGLHEGGLSARAIAAKTGRCAQTVRRVVASLNAPPSSRTDDRPLDHPLRPFISDR
ncbi:hypothetical protein PHYSODRAFT_381358, partial [Phytophthora sojae]